MERHDLSLSVYCANGKESMRFLSYTSRIRQDVTRALGMLGIPDQILSVACDSLHVPGARNGRDQPSFDEGFRFEMRNAEANVVVFISNYHAGIEACVAAALSKRNPRDDHVLKELPQPAKTIGDGGPADSTDSPVRQ